MKKKLLCAMAICMLAGSLSACAKRADVPGQPPASQPAAEQPPEETSDGGFALDGTWPAETVKIAVETYDVTDVQYINIQNYYDYLEEHFNIEFMYSESIASPEDELNFIQNASTSGCKALVAYYNVSQSESVKLCSELGMYYWGQADEDAIYDECKNDPYYLGAYDNGTGDYNAGYLMAQTLIDQGCKKIVYCSGGKDFGIQMFIDRAQGFYDAVKESDAEVVYEVSGWPGTDPFTAAQTTVLGMDIDAIASAFTAAPWIQPIADSNKLDGSIRLGFIGTVDEVFQDLASSGIASCILYDCEESLWGSAISTILNAVSGHADVTRNESGEAANYEAPRWIINNGEAYNSIFEKHEAGEWFVTAEELANTLVEYNPDATYQTLTDTYSTLTLEAAMQK